MWGDGGREGEEGRWCLKERLAAWCEEEGRCGWSSEDARLNLSLGEGIGLLEICSLKGLEWRKGFVECSERIARSLWISAVLLVFSRVSWVSFYEVLSFSLFKSLF